MSTNDSYEKNGDQMAVTEVNQLESNLRGEQHEDTLIPIAIRYAGFWMRFWAYLLDLIVIGSVNRLVVYPLFRAIDLPIAGESMFAPAAIVTALIFYLYFVLMTKYYDQTLGKMVFGLKVVNLKGERLSWGTVLFREWIGRFISTTLIIAYIVIAFLPKKQGLHDLFAETTVIHEI